MRHAVISWIGVAAVVALGPARVLAGDVGASAALAAALTRAATRVQSNDWQRWTPNPRDTILVSRPRPDLPPLTLYMAAHVREYQSWLGGNQLALDAVVTDLVSIWTSMDSRGMREVLEVVAFSEEIGALSVGERQMMRAEIRQLEGLAGAGRHIGAAAPSQSALQERLNQLRTESSAQSNNFTNMMSGGGW